MGRRFRNFRQKFQETREKFMNPDVQQRIFDAVGGGDKPDILKADIIMISGCDDSQTSADVSNVA